MNDEQIVKADAQEIYLGNLRTVEFDLHLPTEGKNGAKITWASGDDRFLKPTGQVVQPSYGRGDRVIDLTATVTYGQASVQVPFKVTVLEAKNDIHVNKIFPIQLTAVVGEPLYLPQAAAVETTDQQLLPQYIIWDQGDRRDYTARGTEQATGHIKGTTIPVTAQITIQETAPAPSNRQRQVIGEPLANVRLIDDTPEKRAQDRRLRFLLTVDDDQMLYNFRHAAGLDTQGAPAMVGWDAPDSNLRGHTTGHYLSALALAYAATGNESIKAKLHYMVQELGKVQAAFSGKPGIHPGFLSAYDETQFNLLEEYTPYPQIWAPYYTLHKILAGLIDAYELAGDQDALRIATGVGQWVYNRLSRLSVEKLKKMWGMYIAGEFGGINESLAELYHLTQDPHMLTAARYFDNDRLFFPMEQKVDALGSLHANQHIPQVVGALNIYQNSHVEKYYQIADFFWHRVTAAHIYSFGGTGDGEMFHQPNAIGVNINENTAETCASYNMLKLTKRLYEYAPTVDKMDYYELTTLNHILASTDHTELGGSTYFLSTKPGDQKGYDDDSNTCCHGTGLENHFKYGEAIYFTDEKHVYVNLFIASRLKDDQNGLDLTLHGDFNHPETATITVNHSTKQLVIRHPYWSKTVTIMNGDTPVTAEERDGYLYLPAQLAAGTTLALTFTPTIRLVPTPDKPELLSVAYGPYILAALSDGDTFLEESIDPNRPLTDQFTKVPDQAALIHNNTLFVPLAVINYEHYHIYVRE
ncbi:beta-L-arabinofuranosidase domain-containing protein [Schleiferilactobacillus harbinensis]|uniref:beta-L-arabinofuranosidase domain-containing protein n=1 Tax=Schleiferilactobacillus harbinensis TaxID=304207 RepID=UPI0011667A93|nr:beta-L-arabinofuranosidase domain-containing protein [Schleiferilactobacillus harbinensis]GEK06911.1 hypothetical protein LHA01_21500 [Schleiferilactobacillus harbinensis]